MEKEKLIDKIKKLMALGLKHEETPEGRSALEKAKSLMEEHNVRMMDVEDDGSIKDENLGEIRIEWGRNKGLFESHLMKVISEALDCQSLRWAFGTPSAQHILIGTKTDTELAEWLFKYVRLQCYKMAGKTPYKGKELRTYLYGMYFTLKPRIQDLYGQPEEEVELSDCTALVHVKMDQVVKYKEQLYPKVKKGRDGGSLQGSRMAFDHGKSDGNKVRLNRQVDNSSESNRRLQ